MSQNSLRVHFLSIGASDPIAARISEIASEFAYNVLPVKTTAEMQGRLADFEDTPFCLFEVTENTSEKELTDSILLIRKSLRDCFLCVVIPDKDIRHWMDMVNKTGVNLVLSTVDVLQRSRLEYVASQIIRASYLPVKVSEFPKDVVLDFTLYHLMPLNQRMLPVLPKATALSEIRMKKLEELPDLFVKRDELDKYKIYMDSRHDSSAGGLKDKVRAKFLSFASGHSQLIFSLIDRAEQGTSKEGKWLYDRCEILARDLVMSMSALSASWEVINEASIGEVGSVERSPTIAAYSGVLSLLSSIGEPIEVMMSCLLSDLGMLDLPPQVTKKIRKLQDAEKLDFVETKEYQKHPVLSLKHCDEQNFNLKTNVRKIILNSHERVNQSGFPNKPPGDQIPFESMILQFCEMIDNMMIVRLAGASMPIQDVRRQILTHEMTKLEKFNYGFLDKIKPVM